MRAVVSVLMIAALPAGVALAGPKPEGMKTIVACLVKAEETGAFGGTCIGELADPCIATARSKPNYQAETRQCAARELNAWTELMQKAISATSKNADAPTKTVIAESQKAWAQSREKLCSVFDNLDPGASLGGADYCRLQETAIRVLSLRRLSGALTPH